MEAPNLESRRSSRELVTVGRCLLFLIPLAVVAIADLWTKHLIFQQFYPRQPEYWNHAPTWWIEGILGIQTSTNPGALFGIGSGYSWLFAALSIIVFFVVILWLFVAGGARDRWLTFAFGLVSGGIIGNLYDRLGWGYLAGRPIGIKYHVRDWILFRLEGVPFFDPWPNFNIADAGLVIGASMLLLHAFFVTEPVKQSKA